MGQLPVLEITGVNGQKTPLVLHETHSILRYLAREFGEYTQSLCGRDAAHPLYTLLDIPFPLVPPGPSGIWSTMVKYFFIS